MRKELLTSRVNDYISESKGLPYSNEESWKLCYDAFNPNNNKDSDLLALHLTAYLASWGMYRGSAGLYRTSYKVHIKAIEIIKEFGIERLYCREDQRPNKDQLKLIIELKDKLSKYYGGIEYKLTKNETDKKILISPTDTLLSKIILGTTGSTIAYDTNVQNALNKSSLKEYRINTGLELDSLKQLYSIFFEDTDYRTQIESLAAELKYPQMKILDMFLFQVGLEYNQPIKVGDRVKLKKPVTDIEPTMTVESIDNDKAKCSWLNHAKQKKDYDTFLLATLYKIE